MRHSAKFDRIPYILAGSTVEFCRITVCISAVPFYGPLFAVGIAPNLYFIGYAVPHFTITGKTPPLGELEFICETSPPPRLLHLSLSIPLISLSLCITAHSLYELPCISLLARVL